MAEIPPSGSQPGQDQISGPQGSRLRRMIRDLKEPHAIVIQGLIAALVASVGIWFAYGKSDDGIDKVTPGPTSASPSPSESPKPVPLAFRKPKPNEAFGLHASAKLVGDVPAGHRLWIVVSSGQKYYIQGPVDDGGDEWTFDEITLGGSDTKDIGKPYIIVAVVADSVADKEMQNLEETTGGDHPIDLPKGAVPGPTVMVRRTE